MRGARPRAPDLDDDGCLIDDIACRGCGYSLRGLKPDGACPECTAPIERSIRGDMLQYADPDWVSRLARGAGMLALALVLSIALPVAVILLKWPALGATPAAWRTLPFSLALMLPLLLRAVAIWLATAPDPALRDRESPWSARSMARWLGLLAAALAMLAIITGGPLGVTTMRPFSAWWTTTGSVWLRTAWYAAQAIIAAAAVIALLKYAIALALRVPDERLSRQCRGVLVVFALASFLHVSLRCVSIYADGAGFRGALSGGARAALGLSGAALALCGVWCVTLSMRFRAALQGAAKMSRDACRSPASVPHADA